MNLKYTRIAKNITAITVFIFIAYGLIITVFPLLPFWVDEWMLLDNIKFKPAPALWNTLQHTQQFPRVYLQIVKALGSAFDYSYTSLRVPSFVTHCMGIALLYGLSARIFGRDRLSRWTWVLIYISFNTSIHYFVQVKQYTMEMALSLVAIWQLLELVKAEREKPVRSTLVLLILSFCTCTFFSYTYPIALAPVYLVILLRACRHKNISLRILLPLLLGMAAIAVFYIVDVHQVLADPGMQDFWQGLLMKQFSSGAFFRNSYAMFCTLGTGDLFAHIFGILGVAAFLYSNYVTALRIFRPRNEYDLVVCYGCLLIWVVLLLFVTGKLPLGTFRLNSFVVPALGVMILHMLEAIATHKKWRIPAMALIGLLFLSAAGTVYATMAELFTPEHAKKIRIYNNCDRALLAARRQHLPVLVTPGVAYPFDDRWPGDWILKTHPRYKTYDTLEVYPIARADSAVAGIRNIQHPCGKVMIIDGDTAFVLQYTVPGNR